ncbi:MAG TPA: carboxypeptidase-like regulatory domain-containing protein [Casimicrobiaceae bacterium]
MSRSRLVRLIGGLACVVSLAALMGQSAFATTIVAGTVRDATTDAPVTGARVTIRRGNELLGSAVTASGGIFQLPFEIAVRPDAQNLQLFVTLEEYVESSQDVTVTSGRANAASYRFNLVPRSVADCIRTREHTVVVGYFRPSTSSAGDADLAARVADALNYDLLVRMQQGRLGRDALPIIVACGRARPQSIGDYTNFAKVLNADAFLGGYVDESGPRRVKVQMSVADRFERLVPPLQAASKDVNLGDPAVARLDPSAHVAILTALVTGYERSGKFAECIEFTVAAARILGSLPPALAEARRRCEQAVPNRGLLPGGAP